MKLNKALIVAAISIMQFSLPAHSLQNPNENNPFVAPSQRLTIKDEPEQIKESSCEQIDSESQNLTKMLEMELNKPIDEGLNLPDGSYKDWSKNDVEKSRFIGEINGYRVYFNSEKQVYFNLDTDVARSIETEK